MEEIPTYKNFTMVTVSYPFLLEDALLTSIISRGCPKERKGLKARSAFWRM